MADMATNTVAVHLPAELVAKMQELKEDREEDRGKPVEELVRELCQSYVTVREMHREELAHADELNRSYQERPSDWDDAEEWEALLKRKRGGAQ